MFYAKPRKPHWRFYTICNSSFNFDVFIGTTVLVKNLTCTFYPIVSLVCFYMCRAGGPKRRKIKSSKIYSNKFIVGRGIAIRYQRLRNLRPSIKAEQTVFSSLRVSEHHDGCSRQRYNTNNKAQTCPFLATLMTVIMVISTRAVIAVTFGCSI